MSKTTFATGDDLLATFMNKLNNAVPTGDNNDGSFPLIHAQSGGTGAAYTLSLSFGPASTQFPQTYQAGLIGSFRAHAANTGAATLNINSIGAKDIRRPNGAPLQAGDIQINDYVIFIFDSTNDYFIVTNYQEKHIPGGYYKNLVVKNNASNPTYQIDVDADAVVLEDSNNRVTRHDSINVTIDISTTGADGRQADENGGLEKSSDFYNIWLISNGTTVSGFASLTTSPTLPSGYTYKLWVGSIYNDSGGDLLVFYQRDHRVSIETTRVLNGGTSASYASVDLSSLVPSQARRISGTCIISNDQANPARLYMSPSSSGAYGEITNYDDLTANTGQEVPYTLDIMTDQTIYYKIDGDAGNKTANIDVAAFEY